jgi:hypothetical protein
MTTHYKTEAEAIEAFIVNARSNGPVPFDGQNCEDAWDEGANCAGWDGESRRCECGNRRVCLQTSRDKDGMWSAYAEAY